MEGDWLGLLGEAKNGGGAVFYEAETEIEDAEGVTLVESVGVGGVGEVGGLGGDGWEKEGEDDKGAEGEQVHPD